MTGREGGREEGREGGRKGVERVGQVSGENRIVFIYSFSSLSFYPAFSLAFSLLLPFYPSIITME